MLKEFRDFLTRGNLLEIAVGLILALAFAAVVTAFTNIVLSFVAAIFGGDVSFDRLTFRVGDTPIPYGAFLTALINFVIIGWVLFMVVRAYERFRTAPDAATKPCPYCRTDIAVEATRCPNCTSQLGAA
jgi:large conductance mechanosensitive channel